MVGRSFAELQRVEEGCTAVSAAKFWLRQANMFQVKRHERLQSVLAEVRQAVRRPLKGCSVPREGGTACQLFEGGKEYIE